MAKLRTTYGGLGHAPQENFGFLEVGNAIYSLLTGVFKRISLYIHIQYICTYNNTDNKSMLIENIQRWATKFILSYSENMSYLDRLQKANLLPLGFRKEISDMTLLFKSEH